jgi:lipid A ethanolaminephosphotransferase
MVRRSAPHRQFQITESLHAPAALTLSAYEHAGAPDVGRTGTTRFRLRIRSWFGASPMLHAETLAFLASLFFTLACNGAFWSALMSGHDFRAVDTWLLVVYTGLLLTGLHWFLLLLVVNRWTVKPALLVLALSTAAAVYFMARYSIYLDKSMLRNLFETDVKEASELLDWRMLPYLMFYGTLPAWLLYRVRVRRTPWRRAMLGRSACLLLAIAMAGGGLWAGMRELVPTVRAHGEMRHLVTPSNYIFGSIHALSREAHDTKVVIAPDARRAALPRKWKPIAFVLVVGETARAANWGLNGYRRQTTPELAARHVINFTDASSCGTDTATSVPCMFSVYGRHNYSERHIRGSESLLHVLHHAGVSVLWRDNQAGCKGVCDGLPFENLANARATKWCADGRCFDGILADGLKQKIAAADGDVLIVLHMLGNHGPAYYQRYPPAFRRWQPTCDTTDLASCSPRALVNTYDNAIRYTDYVLAQTIDSLASVTTHRTGLLYLSDHGESLGEHNLYLHGMPYVIAPKEQTRIPMDLWLSEDYAASAGLDAACLATRAAAPASHDHLFHTLLRVFDIHSAVYDPAWDLTATCRDKAPA